MDEMADDLAVSKKTIYKCFPSKDKLVQEIAERMILQISTELKIVTDNPELDVISKLIRILEIYNTRIACCSERWYRDLELHAPHVWKKIQDMRSQKIYELLDKLIKQGNKEKLMAKFPPQIVIASFVSTIRSVGSPAFLMENRFTMREAFRYSFELLLNGILTEEGRDRYRTSKNSKFKVQNPRPENTRTN